MDTKHTPGPWRVDPRNCGDIQDEEGHEIASAFYLGNVGEEWTITGDIPWSTEQLEANARLIAAAPELLEALQELIDGLVLDLPQTENFQVVKTARAAIAKATQP